MHFNIWYILAIFQVVWGVFAFRWVYKLRHGGLDYLIKEDPEIASKFEPFRRKDIQNWNKFEVYFGAIFLLPYRFTFTILMMAVCGILCKILTIGVDLEKEISTWRRLVIRAITSTLTRFIMYANGIYHIERKYHRITDFDPTYPKEYLTRKPDYPVPVGVCNHISFLDIYYFMICRHYPCFLAKKEVASYPIFGWIARVRQGVFVKREDRTQKDAVLGMIKERVQNIKNGQKFPPMIIFPEGTTTNGSAIMAFKKGAFVSLSPVRIFALEYPRKRFSPAFDNMDVFTTYLLMQCHFYNRIRVHDIGIYYPDHLNLKDESEWEIYAEKVQNIMAKCLNVPTTPMSFNERMEYYNYSQDLKKKFKKERSTKKTDQIQ